MHIWCVLIIAVINWPRQKF